MNRISALAFSQSASGGEHVFALQCIDFYALSMPDAHPRQRNDLFQLLADTFHVLHISISAVIILME